MPVGSSPVAAQVAPDGRFAYVANRDAGVLTVVDTATEDACVTQDDLANSYSLQT